MMFIRVFVVLFTVSCFCLSQERHHVRLAVVGDSITDSGYPGELKKLLGRDVDMMVLARKGSRLEEHYDTVASILGGVFRPTHFVLYGGLNDCMLKNSAYVVDMIVRIIDVARLQKMQIVVVKHHPWGAYSVSGNKCSEAVNEWIDRLSIQAVDTSGLGFGGRLLEKYDAGDGLHLNYDGQKELARMIFKQTEW